MSKPNKNTYYLGIRHHGVGSSTRLLSVLNKLKPAKVLIEGASDCSELLALLAHRQMKPPVALLAYATDYPESHFYYPFAEFSPEYQATVWAMKYGADVAFIDLPVAVKLAKQVADIEKAKQAQLDNENQTDNDGETDETETDANTDFAETQKSELSDDDKLTLRLKHDPIGVLAQLAGYGDGEDWWNDTIEQNREADDLADDLATFDAVGDAMFALRQKLLERDDIQTHLDDDIGDDEREAYMRQQIASHQKTAHNDDVIVVVCGAWHVPALDPKRFAELTDKDGNALTFNSKNDNAIIKTLPKKLAQSKVKTTWIPWTSPRLASSQGYRAGVKAPMWYLHLWQNREYADIYEHWLSLVANRLREQGHVISTASVIEAVRLSQMLAVVRGRPSVGFEELIDSSIACLCFGEPLLWQQLEQSLLLGNQVGQIPDDMPLAPLLEDLQRLQKQTKLAPESLAKEISVDLRSEIGLKKSHLLHRLQILGVPWGKVLNSGGSRGTFREKWLLKWKPEFAVALVENLVYGNTILQASANKLTETMQKTTKLNQLVSDVQLALQADLTHTASVGLERLGVLANQTDNTDELLQSLSPLVHLERYGTARAMSLAQVGELVRQLAIKVAIALPYACRNLDNETAERLHELIKNAHHALLLGEVESDVMDVWWQALAEISDGLHQHSQTSKMLVGLCNLLLYQAEKIDSEQLEERLQKALSSAFATQDSAQFFVGFFKGVSKNLLYDDVLLQAVQNWLTRLNGDEFVEYLPLFRRVFADLDPTERKHLLEKATKGKAVENTQQLNQAMYPLLQTHLTVLQKLLGGDKNWASG